MLTALNRRCSPIKVIYLRQIEDADYKYVVSDNPLPPDHVTPRMRIANFAIKMAHSHCFQP